MSMLSVMPEGKNHVNVERGCHEDNARVNARMYHATDKTWWCVCAVAVVCVCVCVCVFGRGGEWAIKHQDTGISLA